MIHCLKGEVHIYVKIGFFATLFYIKMHRKSGDKRFHAFALCIENAY